MNVVFRMATRKIINQNVSSGQAKLSTETLADLKRLHLVSRFYNARQQHGNQRAQAWNFFGFLFYDSGKSGDQTGGEVVSILLYINNNNNNNNTSFITR